MQTNTIPQTTPKYVNLLPAVTQPKFPDYSSNYQKMLADKAQEAAALAAQEATQAAQAAQATVYTTPPSAPVIQPENWYRAWIYNEESGNNPQRWNSEGCVGLGQACPASKLINVCPNLDYGCEDNFFTGYMLARYGSWQAAYYFHIANNWW